jgi:hypothetical protein
MSCSPKELEFGSIETIKIPVTGKVNGVYIDLPAVTTNLEVSLWDNDLPVLVVAGIWETYGRNYWATALIDTTLLIQGRDYEVKVGFQNGGEVPLLGAENLLTVV